MDDVNALLDEHVTLRCESIDRMLLNGYVPRLQTPEGLARFLKGRPARRSRATRSWVNRPRS